MPDDASQRLRQLRPVLELRSRAFSALRSFFLERGYVEVETPIRVPVPCMEQHIDVMPADGHWLRTSPELHMKRMVCAGYERIFQVGSCFRQGETGQRHNPEYTMLEWYRTGATYTELIDEARELVLAIAGEICQSPRIQWNGRTVDLDGLWDVKTVRDLFWLHAGWDPTDDFDGDRFDIDLVDKVEPVLEDADVPVVVIDYPREQAALARLSEDNPDVAERWELYIAGMEVANAYSELTDPVEQRQRFEHWATYRRSRGLPVLSPR